MWGYAKEHCLKLLPEKNSTNDDDDDEKGQKVKMANERARRKILHKYHEHVCSRVMKIKFAFIVKLCEFGCERCRATSLCEEETRM